MLHTMFRGNRPANDLGAGSNKSIFENKKVIHKNNSQKYLNILFASTLEIKKTENAYFLHYSVGAVLSCFHSNFGSI